MSFQYINGLFVDADNNITLREPAILINTASWNMVTYGELKCVEEYFNKLVTSCPMLIFSLNDSYLRPKERARIINSFLENRNYLKFQLIKLFKKRGDKLMFGIKSVTKDDICTYCGETVVDLVNDAESIYVCPECGEIYCEHCLLELESFDDDEFYDDFEDTTGIGSYVCPTCEHVLHRVEEEDIQSISKEEMFH